MNFNPLVSIIIPVYNGSNYLRESIDSALSQTYTNIEVIVVNDGSTDNGKTENIALSFGSKIRYFYKKNGGVSSAFNLGIQNMKGEYFSWLSHDDVYYSIKIDEQINFLIENNLYDKEVVLYSDYNIINEKSQIVQSRKIDHAQPEYFRWLLLTTYPLNGNTVLIPKLCFEKVGLFNEEFKTQQDYDMWMRLSKFYPFFHLNKILIESRIHSERGTIKLTKLMRKNSYELYISFINSIDLIELMRLTKQVSVVNSYHIIAKKQANLKNIDIAYFCCNKSINHTHYNKFFFKYLLLIQCSFIYNYRLLRTFIVKRIRFFLNLLKNENSSFNF